MTCRMLLLFCTGSRCYATATSNAVLYRRWTMNAERRKDRNLWRIQHVRRTVPIPVRQRWSILYGTSNQERLLCCLCFWSEKHEWVQNDARNGGNRNSTQLLIWATILHIHRRHEVVSIQRNWSSVRYGSVKKKRTLPWHSSCQC